MATITLEFSIDWLNYTCYRLNTIGWYLIAKRFPQEAWSATKGHHGYTLAAINTAQCRVMINPEREDMGQHVQYSGQCLNMYRNEVISARDIIQHHALYGDICKRIDLAIDIRDSQIRPRDYYNKLDGGSARTKSKSWSIIEGNGGGQTLYVGSRVSEMMLRLYDKGIESGIGGDWIRAELEIKGSRALEVSRMLAVGQEHEAMKMARALMRGHVDFNTEHWDKVTGDFPITIAKAKDNTPDTELWIMTQVATAMAKLIRKQGDDALLARFCKRVEDMVKMDLGDTQ
jgi:hypothetical protein